MTKDELVASWKAHRKAGKSIRDTSDPELIAGCYVDWRGDVKSAISALKVHYSGQYLDMPPFAGCGEAIKILEALS